MITDKCVCGAEFSVKNDSTSTGNMEERQQHDKWLAAHAVCRERAKGDEDLPYWEWQQPIAYDGIRTDTLIKPSCGGTVYPGEWVRKMPKLAEEKK